MSLKVLTNLTNKVKQEPGPQPQDSQKACYVFGIDVSGQRDRFAAPPQHKEDIFD